MKRVVVCAACVDAWQRLVGKYPGETVTIRKGTAISCYTCDDCATPIESRSFAACVSISTPANPYLPWELDYIKQFPEQYQSALGPLPR